MGVLTILHDQNGIFYFKMLFCTKNLPIFTKKLHFFCSIFYKEKLYITIFTIKKLQFFTKKVSIFYEKVTIYDPQTPFSQSVSQGATPRSEPRSADPCVDDRLGHRGRKNGTRTLLRRVLTQLGREYTVRHFNKE